MKALKENDRSFSRSLLESLKGRVDSHFEILEKHFVVNDKSFWCAKKLRDVSFWLWGGESFFDEVKLNFWQAKSFSDESKALDLTKSQFLW